MYIKRHEILCEYICTCVCICVSMCAHTNAHVRTRDFSSYVKFLVNFPNECIYDRENDEIYITASGG